MAIIDSIVVLSSVILQVIIQTSECKPQLQVTVPDNNDDFLALLQGGVTEATSTLSSIDQALVDVLSGNGVGECKCLPIGMCCDDLPEISSSNSGSASDAPVIVGVEGIGIRTIENEINQPNLHIDIGDRSILPCSDVLSVCCVKECQTSRMDMKAKDLSPTTQAESNQCGIRNTNGFRITMTGFEDDQAQLSEFPWMVAVLGTDNTYVGGGSLVHAKVVLTAAHKVHGHMGSMVARIGDWDLSSATTEPIPSQTIKVTKVIYHPDFNQRTLVNDVALLFLEEEAVLGDTVMPICLPEIDQVFDESTCLVSGWGKDVFGQTGKYQKIMKKVSVPAVNHIGCQRMLRNTQLGSTFLLHDTFNCAGGEGEDACEGDGGSPLVCPNPNNPEQYIQMGVVAWGIGCGIVGNPGVYGSVPKTVKWIRETIQIEVGFDIRVIARDANFGGK